MKELEKAKRDYPIGTKFRSAITGIEQISTGIYEKQNEDIYIVDDQSKWCIYNSIEKRWAEIIKEDTTLLEKAKRDYPIGTKFRSTYDNSYEYTCNDEPYDYLGYIHVKDAQLVPRCIYYKDKDKWAEIIKEENMTQQEFNSLEVGETLGEWEILHKFKGLLIIEDKRGYDLVDLDKINKLGLKVTPKTFMGLDIKKYDNVPCEINGNTLVYLVEVGANVIWVKDFKDRNGYIPSITSIRIL